MKIFEVSNKKIVDRFWKDAQDKQDMKEEMMRMVQYINAILHLEPKPLSDMFSIMDITSSSNQHFLDNL